MKKTIQHSKVIDLLKSLGKKELNEFGRLLNFNTRTSDSIHLFKYLKGYYPDFEPKKPFFRNVIAQKLFDGNDKKLHFELTKLSNHIQDFIIQKHIEKNKIDRDFVLLNAYRDRGLEKHYVGMFKGIEKSLEEGDRRDANYHLQRFQVNHERFYHASFSKMPKNAHLEIYQTFEDMMMHLDNFYLMYKAKNFIVWSTWRNLANIKYHDFFPDLLDKVRNKSYRTAPPLLNIYVAAFDLISNQHKPQTYEEYETLKNKIKQYRVQATHDEQRFLLELLINYSGMKLMQNNHRFLEETWLLYLFGIKYEMLLKDERLPAPHFNNIVSLGLSFDEKQANHLREKILPKIKSKLAIPEKENVLMLAEAQIAFKMKKYKEAAQLLQKVHFINNEYKFRVKCLDIQIAYETNEWMHFFNLVQLFKRFLRNQKGMSEIVILRNKRFVMIVNELGKIRERIFNKERHIQKEIPLLLAKIKERTKNEYANITWINQKIDELEKLAPQKDEETFE